MKKVLVIGDSSYIGINLIAYIKKKYMDEMDISGITGKSDRWRTVDFSEYHCVILLSAIVHRKEKNVDTNLYYKINYEMAVNIAKEAKEKGVSHFIFMSTAAVYNEKVSAIGLNTVTGPTTLYGKTKLMAEKKIIELESESFRISIIRVPMVYGENCKGNYRTLSRLARYSPIFLDSRNTRSFINVSRLSERLTEIIMGEVFGIIHIRDVKNCSTYVLYENIRKNNNKNTIAIRIPNFIHKILVKYITKYNKVFGDMYFMDELNS